MLHRANMRREMIDITNAPLIHGGSEWEEKRTVGRIRCNVLERGHLLMKRAIRACRVQHVHFRERIVKVEKSERRNSVLTLADGEMEKGEAHECAPLCRSATIMHERCSDRGFERSHAG